MFLKVTFWIKLLGVIYLVFSFSPPPASSSKYCASVLLLSDPCHYSQTGITPSSVIAVYILPIRRNFKTHIYQYNTLLDKLPYCYLARFICRIVTKFYLCQKYKVFKKSVKSYVLISKFLQHKEWSNY